MTASSRWRPSRFALALAALTALAALLRWYGLPGSPPLGDDLLARASAVNFLERGGIGPTMWQHPRLRDLLVYASVATLGGGKLGLVMPSLLLGVLAVPLVGLLGRRAGGAEAGVLAAALLALDPLHVGYSRQAVQETYTAFFGVAAVLLFLRARAEDETASLVAAGAAFGLGLASKWSVAFPLALALAWALAAAARGPGPQRPARLAAAVVALGVVPATVYVACWTPWLLAGHGIAELVELHRLMVSDVATHAGYDPTAIELPHRAVRWFLAPTWHADFTMGPQGPVPYVTITNPTVWLLVLPSLWVCARLVGRDRDRRGPLAFVAAAFAATYVPFLLASRPIWIHSALAVLPYAIVLVATAVWRAVQGASRPALLAAGYVGVVALAAAPLYVVATGHGLGVPVLRSIVEAARPAGEPDAP